MNFAAIERQNLIGDSFGLCFFNVGINFFEPREEIISIIKTENVHSSSIDKYGFVGMGSAMNWTFYLTKMNLLSTISYCFIKDYILEVENYSDLYKTFENIKSANCWNQNQKFFISSAAILPDYELQFKKMIQIVMEEKLNNVVIMIPIQANDSTFQIYYWAEIYRERCKPKKYSKFLTCKFGNLMVPDNFTENVTSTKCSLKVKAVVWPPYVILSTKMNKTFRHKPVGDIAIKGIEVELMNVVSKYLKIRVEYYPSLKNDWGHLNFDGSATSTMKDLMTRKVDIAIGSFSISYSRTVIFRMSQSYDEDHVILCVGYNSYVKFWSAFFNLSGLKLCFFILITYVLLTTLIWKTSQSCEGEHSRYRKATLSYLYCFAVLIGISVNVLPSTRRARIFFSLLLIFELFYVAFYESLLASLLSTAKNEQTIKTLYDIFDQNMDIYGASYNQRYLSRIDTRLEKQILKHWIDCEDVEECLEDVFINRNKAICIDENFKNYELRNSIREDIPGIYCLKQRLISYPIGMIMRKTLPIKEKIDDIIGRCAAGGLIDKWSSSAYSNGVRKAYTDRDDVEGTLKFSNLKPIFNVVAVGYILFGVVFFVELSYLHFLLYKN
ncbi:hypothetical protein HHI36_017129 [Cryptolaemus montrouzieri]|uniref:Ionotropic receptor n=1 Tax=Cryptolaemus montrouzieri TaxID=559131 RepID=A0ABD2NLW3_9CUCU